MPTPPTAAVDLYWIPLGAGGHSVRLNGRVFEAIQAARGHRQRCELYHSALVVEVDGDRYAIEVAPSLEAALDRGLELTPPGEELTALPTYTAMLALRDLVARRGFVKPYWEEAA